MSAATRSESLRAAASGELAFPLPGARTPRRAGVPRPARQALRGPLRRRRGALHLELGPRLPARLSAPRRRHRRVRQTASRRIHRDGDAACPRRHRCEPRPPRHRRTGHRIRPRQPDDVGAALPRLRRQARRAPQPRPTRTRDARSCTAAAGAPPTRSPNCSPAPASRWPRITALSTGTRVRASTRISRPDGCRQSSPRQRSAWASTSPISAG